MQDAIVDEVVKMTMPMYRRPNQPIFRVTRFAYNYKDRLMDKLTVSQLAVLELLCLHNLGLSGIGRQTGIVQHQVRNVLIDLMEMGAVEEM